MIYLIVDKNNENDVQRIEKYKKEIYALYSETAECIIQDNRVVTPLGEAGRRLEERGRKISLILQSAAHVYLYRDDEFIQLR